MATESAPLLRKPRSPLRPFLVTVVAGLGVMAAAAVFGKRPPGSGRAAYLEVQQAGAGLVDGLAEDLEADADAKVTVFYDASVDDLFVYGVTALLAFGVDAPFSFEAYETMVGGEDEQVAHDTLCAFRLRDDHDRGLKLNLSLIHI